VIQGQVQGDGGKVHQGSRGKRESHDDSGYARYQGGHRRGVSSASEGSPTTGTGVDFGGSNLMTPAVGTNVNASMVVEDGQELPALRSVIQTGPNGIPVMGHPTGQKKLVKTKGNETLSLPSLPYATKLNMPRPLPDTAYLPLPGKNR